ncbi:polysaccharide biosynthesis protein [Crateriforma conspicua]|uniref:polysaccharide biosynthesis protein n=1 Tax=Crateriforma conspicua TaxID=2527996 RepID=UPI00118828EA|nr:nucleoside-diphosphate sugar epimerase/dehydratase [Crateriforma conspicua]QDV65117.1 UDP-N-acetyl-alpha-D-glucosamine C6 dehydratase [Crateriforma conspicua]
MASKLQTMEEPRDVAQHFLVRHRQILLPLLHVGIFSATYLSAFLLRFDFNIPSTFVVSIKATLPAVVMIKLIVFAISGQLSGWWRTLAFRDLLGVSLASVLSLATLGAAAYFSNSITVPQSVLVLDALLTLLFIGGLRSSIRTFAEFVQPVLATNRYKRAALLGTDEETIFLASQIQSHGRLSLNVCGLISISPQKRNKHLPSGLAILGNLRELRNVIQDSRIETLLVHTEILDGRDMRWVMDECNALGTQLQIVPRFEDRMHGKGKIPTREIRIDDLLRRDEAKLDLQSIAEIVSGKCVLVTGAGGSIGSEICRQLIRFEPKQLILLGRGENRIYHIEQELRHQVTATKLEPVIADIRDAHTIQAVFEQYRPDCVFHAAAHKHVPLMERSIREAIVNNVVGTRTVCDAADRFGVSRFVMISSDKAVHPTSVMGASKRAAEMYVQCISRRSSTRFMTVRFGNVLGSAGSVVPLFKRQIAEGGPITVTDARMTRFFMTIPEASQLVLQASTLGKGGDLFVLDMGSPIRIVDLAKDMIRLSGLPENAIEIVFTGVRPGEKMHEELADDDGMISPTSHPKIMSIQPVPVDEVAFKEAVKKMLEYEGDPSLVRQKLLRIDEVRFADSKFEKIHS